MDSMTITGIGKVNTASIKTNKVNNKNVLPQNYEYDSYSPSFGTKSKHLTRTAPKLLLVTFMALTTPLFQNCKPEEEQVEFPQTPQVFIDAQEVQATLEEHPELVDACIEFMLENELINHEIADNYSEGGRRYLVFSFIMSNDMVKEWYLNHKP